MNKKNKKKGFTLIEILVVVLIIGALAAIAVPGYMRSVERSKAVDPMTNLAAIARAQNSHKMATYHYSDDITNLDLSLKDVVSEDMASGNTFEGEDFIYKVYGDDRAVATATRKNVSSDKQYELSIDYNTNQIYCRPIENKTCIDLGLEEGQDYSITPSVPCSGEADAVRGDGWEEWFLSEGGSCSVSNGVVNYSRCDNWGCSEGKIDGDVHEEYFCDIEDVVDGSCTTYFQMNHYSDDFMTVRNCQEIEGKECKTWGNWHSNK